MVSMKARVTLGPARPTVEDGVAFARLLDQAQEGMFRIMLGPRAEDMGLPRAGVSAAMSDEHSGGAERQRG